MSSANTAAQNSTTEPLAAKENASNVNASTTTASKPGAASTSPVSTDSHPVINNSNLNTSSSASIATTANVTTVPASAASAAAAAAATTTAAATTAAATTAAAATANVPTNTVIATTTTTTNAATTASSSSATDAASSSTPVEAKNTETDEEAIRNQKLVEEFQYLLEKSQSLFSGLRDLPPTGSHRQWRPYFEKTFEVYTKLWKFQQTHRSILENKGNYGLKRWEVGEIASKIGQLYYHYYLRTSETNYLYETYVFYEAIHERQYFKDILEVKNSALMIKKMRYYARFIIVCLLLNKDENVRQLITELEGLIEEYTKSFKPPDAKEWQMVLGEISTFTEAEKKLVPINLDRTPDKIEHRLSANITERNIVGVPKLKLQEAILVGNYQKQIKFSELTLDMYRMLQSLEREPFVLHPSAAATKTKSTEVFDKSKETSKDDQNASTAVTTNGGRPSGASTNTNSAPHLQTTPEKMGKRSNPHKYLLYRPSLSQLLVYISTAFKDTSDNSALLLYLSADGCAYPDQTVPGYGGGVITNQRNKQTTGTDRSGNTNSVNNANTSTSSSSTANNAPVNNTGAAGGGGGGGGGGSAGGGGAAASLTTAGATSTAASTVGSMTNIANNNNTAAAPSTGATNNKETANNQLADTHHHHINPPSVHCLHPADLIPFTRKPLFLIVDSDHSTEFKGMPNVFDQPVMCLMSPVEYPSSVQDKSEIGSLFTLFLHTPLLGFCSVSDIGNLDQQKWDECVRKISAMEKAIGDLLITDGNVDKNVKRFMLDDFLYYFIVRFVLCGIFLRYHSSFKDDKSFPSSSPSLPESLYTSTEIVTMLGDLTAIADVGTYFSLPAYATTSAANSVINMGSSSIAATAAATGGSVGSAATASTSTLPNNNNNNNTNASNTATIASSPPKPSNTSTLVATEAK